MAHQTNIVQVMKEPDTGNQSEMVKDPVCGMSFPRKEAKSVLFREDNTVYFCSKDCQTAYLHPKKKQSSKAA